MKPPGLQKGAPAHLKFAGLRLTTETRMNGGDIPALELKGLCKSFGGLQATRDVTLKIMPGDRKAIIGPKLHARILPAQRGEAAIAIEALNRMIRVATPLSIRAT